MEGKKKKIGLIVGIILTILIIIIGVVAYLYFATDVFKSSKELFYTNLAKNEEALKGLNISSNILNANEILKDKAYTTKGELTLTTNGTDEFSNMLNNVKITVDGKTDEVEKQAYRKFRLLNGEEELFNFEYLNVNDLYALTSNQVVNLYLAVQNNNLKQLAKNLGIPDTSAIPDKIEITNPEELVQIPEEQINKIFSKYCNIILEQIPSEKYTKQKNASMIIDNQNYEGLNVYTLTLNQKELVSIVKILLQDVKQDDETLNTVLELSNKEKTIDNLNDLKEQIQEFIDDAQEMEQSGQLTENTGLKIDVYVQKDKLIKTQVQIENQENVEAIIEFMPVISEQINQFKLNVTIMQDNYNVGVINIIINRNGQVSFTLTNKDVTYTIAYQENVQNNTKATKNVNLNLEASGTIIGINYNEESEIANNLTIDKLDANSNCVILNSYPAEQLQPLMAQIGERLGQIFTEIGEKTGLNSLLMLNAASNAIDESINQMPEQEKAMFNSQFTQYEGTVIGTNIKALLNNVMSNNQSETGRKVDVSINNTTVTEDINGAITQIMSSNRYNVTFEYSDEGYINLIKITQN